MRVVLGDCILDLERGALLRGAQEVVLRPKTFAVLNHLAANRGRLVAKEELFAAVWPGLVVSDDTLVQSIGELRRALGEDAALLKTVPRRGYRLEAAPVGDSVPSSDAPARPPPEPPLPSAPDSPGVRARREFWPWWVGAVVVIAGVLWWQLAPRLAPTSQFTESRPAIAVLPFVNASPDPARAYLADGLTQDLINSLGRFSALTVMSWNAVLPFRSAPASPGDIAARLGVRYQVEGNVSHLADRVRVNAQLVDGAGRVLWSARFEEARDDALLLQERIAREVAGALAIRVTRAEEQRVAAKSPASFAAYDLLARARPALNSPTRAAVVEARALLRQAIELDPGYAAAHAALAETFHIAISMGWAESPDEYWQRAGELAARAIALDPAEVRAHVILGRIHLAYNRYSEAAAAIDRAIEMNPSDANGLAGRGNVLMWLGRTDAAIESLELARRIDPELNAFDRFALSLAYFLKGRYDAAIAEAQAIIAETPDANFARAVLVASYAELGRTEDAARAAAELRRSDPTFNATTFGNKFMNPDDLRRLRAAFRKAGLVGVEAQGERDVP
jgi:adenylate cyclase